MNETTESLAPIEAVPTSTGGMLARMIALRQHKEVGRFFKFAVVGAMGALIDSTVFNILRVQSWLDPVRLDVPGNVVLSRESIAGTVAFILAVVSNFIWNRYWTYPDSRSKQLIFQLGMFFAINTFGLVIRIVILEVAVEGLTTLAQQIVPTLSDTAASSIGANAAWAIAVIIVMFWNFFVNRFITYNDVK